MLEDGSSIVSSAFSIPARAWEGEGRQRQEGLKKRDGEQRKAQLSCKWPWAGWAAKLSLDVAESLLYLQVVEWNVISAAAWTQVGLISTAPRWEGGLCFWVAPGLTLPRANLRHVPASIQCYHCLSVEQGRKNGIPGLSLWWGWFLDKWAVSEECLKCKDTQECWCKLEVWRAEEKSQLVPFESTLLLACNAVTTRLDKAQHLFVLCG